VLIVELLFGADLTKVYFKLFVIHYLDNSDNSELKGLIFKLFLCIVKKNNLSNFNFICMRFVQFIFESKES